MATTPVPIPQGATIGNAVPIPEGATIGDQSTSEQPQAAPQASNPQAELMIQEDQLGTGFGKGLLDTTAGVGGLIRKGVGALSAISPSRVGEAVGAIPKGTTDALAEKAKEFLVPQRGLSAEQQMAVPHGGLQTIGYAGENLTEFLLGDEALKGLSLADKLKMSGQVAGIFEKSPRLMKALQMGADLEKAAGQLPAEAVQLMKNNPVVARLIGAGMDAVRQAAVSGGQELVKSGGDVGEAAKTAATQGAASAVLGGAGSVIAGAAEKGGKAAETVSELKNIAESAPAKEEVTANAKNAVDTAKEAMHAKYEAGIQDLTERLGDTSVPHSSSPIASTAKDLVAEPVPATQALVAAAKNAAGERIDKPVKALLTKAANETTADWKVGDLVEFRQAVRKLADSYPPGDLNARALHKLLPAVDDTLDQVAKASGDAGAKADYASLRGDYRDKIKYFQPSSNPADQLKYTTAKTLQSGTKDEIGKFLLAGGNTRAKVAAVSDLLGPEETQKLGKDIFGSFIQETKPDGTIKAVNPANIVQKWTKLPPEARDALFDTSIGEKAIPELMKDTQSAAQIQHLMRVAAVAGAGATVGTHFGATGLGTLLGLVAGEGGGGFARGRQVLDYVVNHPNVWKGLGLVAKAGEAAAPVSRAVGPAIKYGAGQGLRNVMQGASGPLGEQQ